MTIHLITAYRRTGKDTLHTLINVSPHPGMARGRNTRWIIYAKDIHFDELVPPVGKRVAFADSVKTEVHRKLKIERIPTETEKDTIFFTDVETGLPIRVRDAYIREGLAGRAEDPEKWCKFALKTYSPSESCVVTDWRFPNECEYSKSISTKVWTWRLFRSAVPIPSMEESSEHSLDLETTDYLLVPIEEDFAVALTHFPQYAEYKRIAQF